MGIDVQKVRMRLEAKQTELKHEIAALLDEEASLGQPGLGVEDLDNHLKRRSSIRKSVDKLSYLQAQ